MRCDLATKPDTRKSSPCSAWTPSRSAEAWWPQPPPARRQTPVENCKLGRVAAIRNGHASAGCPAECVHPALQHGANALGVRVVVAGHPATQYRFFKPTEGASNVP